MKRSIFSAGSALLLTLAGCSAGRHERAADAAAEGTRRLADAERAAARADAAPALARAAWLEYLVASDPAAALQRVEAALAATAKAAPRSDEAEARALALAVPAQV